MAKKNQNGKSRKAKAATKNQNNVAANNNQTNTQAEQQQVQMPEETSEEKIVRKAYELPAEWKICQIAKKRFLNLPAAFQNGAGKEACIYEALASHKDIVPDQERFWIWLVDETNKLTRVWDFEETCVAAGREPRTVAQHLILEGKMVCNAIRLEGLAAYGSKIRMFVEPLFEDKFGLFGDKVPHKTAANE